MSGPTPNTALSGHCSAINDNVLYVLSPTTFQALPLQENATWTSLPTGVPVTGAACTLAIPGGDESQAALYVVGGTSSNSSYGGLQRYNINDKSWESLTPTTNDMQGRTDHSIAYLNESQSIVVYAGSRPDAGASTSSQTFLIGTSSPFNIESFTTTAPPLNQPILLPWDTNSAVMLGGSETNEAVFTFSPAQGWTQLDTNLTKAVPTGARGALVSGSDGSKVVEIYDASVAPNTIQQIVLLGANGATASNGQTVGTSTSKRSESSRKRKRGLNISNWPEYNNTNAPSAIRSDFSVAQDASGLSVISGGSDGTPVNLFNQQKNAWIDNSDFFGDSTSQVPLKASGSTTSAIASSTASAAAAASSSAAASITGGSASKAHMLKVLGITLGVLCGIAALFIIALLVIRYRKQKKRQQQEYVDEKADRMSFQDRGASFMKEAGGSVADLNRMMPPPPKHHFSDGTSNGHSSLAIIAGKFSNNHHSRSTGEKASFDSTAKLVRSPDSQNSIDAPMEMEPINGYRRQSIIRKPVPVARNEPTPPSAEIPNDPEYDEIETRKRSSGWSRYFATNDEGAGLNGYKQAHPNPSSGSLSEYATSLAPSMPFSIPSSAIVPPLDIDFSKSLQAKGMSTVAQGRPSFSHSAEDLAARGATPDIAEGQQAAFHSGNSLEPDTYLDPNAHDYFSRPGVRISTSSKISRRTSESFFSPQDGMSSPWTPMVMGVGQSVRSMGAHSIKQVNVQPTEETSPAMSTSAFPRPPSPSRNYPRPPSSNYTNDRDSHMPEVLGHAMSPPIGGPATLAVPGPAARGKSGNAGFFPGSGNRDVYRPNSSRKIGGLHPGTLAAISASGIAEPENRDSSATVWPTTDRLVSDSYAAARERLRLEREAKDAQQGDPQRETGMSDMSWVNINQR